ncbi:retrovirus-related pol polyprotein from transposon TNT 1-94 [Tanacetum coccineum]
MQLNKEFFQKNNTSVNQTEPPFDQLFELNNLKAELQAKDTTIEKLKANIKRLNTTSTTNSVKKDIDEIETINIELEHRVTKLIAENEHLKQTYKQLYDSIKLSRVQAKEHAESLVNQLKQKSVEITDLNAQLQEKLDPITLAPKDKNNRETYIYYLKHTMEQAVILKDIVEQSKSLNPLDSTSYSPCKSKFIDNTKNDRILQISSSTKEKNKVEDHSRIVKSSLNKLNFVVEPSGNANVQHSILNTNYELMRVKCNSSMFDARHELCFLEFVSDMNASSKSKITATNKVPLREPIPLKVVAQESVVTKVYTRRPKVPKTNGSNSKPKIAKSMISNKTELGTSRGSNTSVAPSSFSYFLGTVKFGNDQIAKIMRYGNYQIGNITMSKVYYVEGLGHNLFPVGQFCNLDLEVAFRKHTCFVRYLEGVDLLLGSRETNLYTLSIGDMMAYSPICLLSKASKTKSWLWHQRLSHSNFDAINHLAKHGLVRGLPKLKFEKDHLCSACAMGKSKKQSHKPKSEDTNQEKLYLLHIDLCGPMRVASVNGKKYVLVIVDDYSRFTWVNFLASKDEASDFIIKFLKMIQVRLNATVRNIRTDNGIEFVNQTLRDYYKHVGISHETSVARTPQQNGVVERRNRTLVEAARTMLIFVQAPLFLWAKAIATACYTQNRSIIRRRYGKTPYELLHDRKPNLSYLYVFGALCYPNNDSENLGKLQTKAVIGIFIGYAPKKKAYRIYNRRTRKIIETIHVDFDELTTMASEQLGSGPRLQCMTPATASSGLVPNLIPQQPFAAVPRAVDLADSPVSTSIDQDVPSTSIPSTQDQEYSLIISQGFDESPKTPHFHDDPLHESLHEDSTSQGLSSNVRPIHTLFESLGRWTKDQPIENVI